MPRGMTQLGAHPGMGRSERSLAFEAHWRSLPRNGLVPPRKAFDPAQAAIFLRNLILVEVPGPDRPPLPDGPFRRDTALMRPPPPEA